MKKMLVLLLLTFSAFADIASVERPNLNWKNDQTAEYIENIEQKMEEIVNILHSFTSIPIDQRQSNYYLVEMNQHLSFLLTTLERTNGLLEHLIWLQDHKLETAPIKKNPNGRGSGG